MTLLDRLLRRTPKDPYWDRFINGALSDPRNEPSEAYRTAPAGNVFPVRSEIPEPARMAQDLAVFASFLGATSTGVAATDAAHLRPLAESDGPGALAEGLPFALVSVVAAEADPDKSPGVGGQQARRISAMVNHSVASYIRELGYQALVCPVDVGAIAPAAGLAQRSKTFIGDAVLTDIPVALGVPVVTPLGRGD
jgi:hypothetical protein